MKQLTLWILLTGLAFCSDAKTGFPAKVKEYAVLKNKAERCITGADYEGALFYYKAAFACSPAGQRDLYNAFIVAYLQNDSAAADNYYGEMIRLGLSDQKLAILEFGKQHHTEPLYRWLSRNYESLHQSALQGPVPAYARLMDSLFDADQVVRANYRHMSQDDIRIMIARDSANLACLKRVIAAQGFPGYRQTGLFENAAEGWVHGNNTIFFILWHCRNLSTILDTEMLAAAGSGDLPPEDYALLMDSRTNNNRYYSRLPRAAATDSVAFAALSKDEEAKADRNRAELGLCSIGEYKRKLEFQQHHHLFYFFSAMHMALAFSFLPVE